jgi:CheY-like chemotaxis protein
MKKRQDATILVIDPSPVTLLATAGILDGFGYGCFCARAIDKALQLPDAATIDAIVIDVGDDAEDALTFIATARATVKNDDLPVIMLADTIWAGLEKRCEAMSGVRCLFKPIDPNVLGDVVDRSLWMPQLSAAHRRRGTRPARPGWVELQ